MNIMKQGRLALVAAALVAAAAPARATAQGNDTTWTWSGQVPAGKWLRISNVNGEVTIEHGTGPNVEVTAVKRWRRSDPSTVHFEVAHYGPNGENTAICALWGDRNHCERDSDGHTNLRNNDVSVRFTVKVPDGVKIDGETVNGGMRISGATAEVEANTVNGSIEVETSGGPVNAETVNGSVRARMGKFPLTHDMEFSSVNGSVIAEFTGDVDADVDLSTVNGRFNTDYPVTVSGRLDPKNLRAKLGKGGPLVKLSTVNGNVELRRRD